MWKNDPARVYKVLTDLISRGLLVQTRQESCLCLTLGPKALQGHGVYELTEPAQYLSGEGFDLADEDAVVFSRKLTALVLERGVIWIPAQ
eukprot:896514-Rhodomonas_salina.1